MHHVGWESRIDLVLLFYFKRAFFLHFSSSPLRTYSLWHCSDVFSFTFRPPFAPHSTPFYFLLFAFPRASIWTVLFSISCPFVFRLLWSCALILSLPFSFAFTDIVIVLSICLCFVVLVGFVWPIWVCLCCWFWGHHCGFGFGITTTLQEVCFYLLWNGITICVEFLSISLECLFKLECFGRMFDVCFWRMFNYMLNVWSMFYNLFGHCCIIEMLVWLECLNGLCV